MQENHLFEYAIVRIVPKVEREEFLNVGVIVYCARQKFLRVRFVLDAERWKAFCPQLDLQELEAHLQAMKRICEGGQGAGPIGKLIAAERFRWLTATRSTMVQTSKVHPGFCENPAEALMALFEQFVAL